MNFVRGGRSGTRRRESVMGKCYAVVHAIHWTYAFFRLCAQGYLRFLNVAYGLIFYRDSRSR